MKPNRYKVRKSSSWKLNLFFGLGFHKRKNCVFVKMRHKGSWVNNLQFSSSWRRSGESSWI